MTTNWENGAATCESCGGRSFTLRYKTSTKVKYGFASLAGPPMHVECDRCGQMFERRRQPRSMGSPPEVHSVRVARR